MAATSTDALQSESEYVPALVETPELLGRMPYVRLIQDDAGLNSEGESTGAKPFIGHKSVQKQSAASWDGNPGRSRSP